MEPCCRYDYNLDGNCHIHREGGLSADVAFKDKPLAKQCEIVRKLERNSVAKYIRSRANGRQYVDTEGQQVLLDIAREVEQGFHHG